MKARFVKKESVNATVASFYFEPSQPIHYVAGQFTELHLPHESADARKDKRWFTLSSAPHEDLLCITTRLNDTASSSFKKALIELPLGSEVSLAAPMGDFVLPKLASLPLIFVAIGIGITPFRSILADLQATGEQRDIQLIHSIRSLEDSMFGDVLGELGEHCHIATENDTQLTGTLITQLTQPSSDHYIYIAGPEHTVERVITELEEQGIPRRHIYTDFFQGY